MHVSSLESLDFFVKKNLGTFPQSKELYAVHFFAALYEFCENYKYTTAILLHEFALKYYHIYECCPKIK